MILFPSGCTHDGSCTIGAADVKQNVAPGEHVNSSLLRRSRWEVTKLNAHRATVRIRWTCHVLTSSSKRKEERMSKDKLFVERRPQGDYAVRKPDSERASSIAATQAE